MEMIEVESSNIKSIGYDAETRILAVQFHKKGAVYHYAEVPPEIHKDLMEAESKGTFFSQNILKQFTGQRQS